MCSARTAMLCCLGIASLMMACSSPRQRITDDSGTSFDGGVDGTGDGDADTDSDTDTDSDVDADTDSDIDGDIDADVDSDIDGDVDSDIDGDVDGDPDGGTDGAPDGGLDASPDGGGPGLFTCAEAIATASPVGCEYWAVDLDNSENEYDDAAAGTFALAVANLHDDRSVSVVVEVNTGAYSAAGSVLDLDVVDEIEIEAESTAIIELPRRDADGDNVTDGVDDGPQTWLSSRAFRLTSDAPVVAYQMNPVDPAYSNDGSLLRATSGLGTRHIAVTHRPANPVPTPIAGLELPVNRAFVSVVGTEPGTTVTVVPTTRTLAGGGLPSVRVGESLEVVLGPFDLLNLETDDYTMEELRTGPYPNLNGTIVTADAPVAVFGGTDLSMVTPLAISPADHCCADHVETQVLPVSALGRRYAVSRSPRRSPTGAPEEDHYIIIGAHEAGTATVETSLPGALGSFDLEAGEVRDLWTSSSFVLDAGEPVLVAQLIVSKTVTGRDMGDPALLVYSNETEWVDTYGFATGRGFDEDYAVVVAAEGASITLDGESLTAAGCTAPRRVGNLGGVFVEQSFCAVEQGGHLLTSADGPFQVTVYGYSDGTAHAFPAGGWSRRR